MWGALDGAAKQRYKEDAPMVEVKARKPRSDRASSRTPPPPPPPPDEGLRSGGWTSEEKAYAEKLLELLQSGRLPEGPERPDDGVRRAVVSSWSVRSATLALSRRGASSRSATALKA